MQAPAATRPFYGWFVVAGAFLVLFIGFGAAYSFAAFFQSLKDQFDATRGQLSLVFAITGALYFSLGAISGLLADRFGPRRVIAAGVLLIAAGLLTASRAQTLWQVYLTYSVGVGLGVGFAYVPAVGAVQRWFVRRRGFASGLAVAGIGIGTLAAPPLAAGLIDLTDWRTTYVLLAALTLAVGLAAARLIEHSPAGRGLQPDGGGQEPGARSEERAGLSRSSLLAPGSYSLRDALRSRPFWLLYGGTAATCLGLFIPFVHLAPYARDHGLSEVAGAVLVGLIGAGSAVGRLALGGAADRLGRRRSLALAFTLMAAMQVWWLFSTSAWALTVFALIFGAAYGGFVALLPALTVDYFGTANAGGIIGFLYTAASAGTLIGPTVAGVMYDVSESYTVPIILSVIANLVAVGCVMLLADPDRWRRAH
ncbi:MAG: MFS transporter [Chloroflexi bacterium]|nr:MFS transporter [Chloroflexota bacterium]